MSIFDTLFNYVGQIYTDRLPYFPANIRVSLLIILFCVIATIELYFYMMFSRAVMSAKNKRMKYWDDYISMLLANMIVFDETDKPDEIVAHFYPKLSKMPLHSRLVNSILVEKILTYHKNFTGKTAEVLSSLYLKLNLDKKTKRKIKNRNWETKIEGIREANEMDLVEMADLIVEYTDDENALLRMEAQAAYIKLSQSDPFHFLDRAQERILDWHQVVLFEIITKHKKLTIPSFSKWLHSSNDTVVMLCLKLVDHFMQFDAAKEVVTLLKHQNPKIVRKAVEIIGKLELEDAERFMFEIYFNHDDEIKLEILNALGKIASGNYSEFLSSRIYSTDVKIKKEALYAIKIDPDRGEEKLRAIYLQTGQENQALIKHVLDHRIR
ncbi:HEAT repeat domain-containing protein [Pedobacter sp. SL55]|uniref:HEAT repeat domain-containing protein n=1 Tax=Pedobacter sp. SL55 TaxID=2995161 RepID=UPI0022701C72|nr:HEAT repeat domain-containing protein [Pedobacter sp. SL55]WAC39522.1 HEAT repeat domain-containing protein [Pedobacter sp. SL55]